jgi:hypothetical protein
LSISREDLESLTAMKSLDLTWPLSPRSPTLTIDPVASIHFSLIYENRLVGTEGRYFMYILVSQVWVTVLGGVLGGFLGPLDVL